ncbi:MAG: 5-(carboxyamino)imidazole ribonucleotide synthase [Verrucomicrobium sp.]|nr:5-(carboxyamino)imidazole ribonucleotide synthase [Verrucomicrobium sp.]
MTKQVLPGGTIGILGGGQLGRMFALAAHRLGYRIHVYHSSTGSPAGQVADKESAGSFEDEEALRSFARGLDVATYEFENIPLKTLEILESEGVSVRPGKDILHTAQSRRREKEFLSRHGFPVAPHRIVHSAEELAAAARDLGFPCVLKTVDFGYDGKGQQKLAPGFDDAAVWARHGQPAGIVEAWLDCRAELSVLVARGGDGQASVFPISRNDHRNQILDLSIVPADLPPESVAEARRVALAVAEQLGLVGLLAVEFFLTTDGRVLVNEMAPRPHNSGHYSLDACVTSQFEQQLRAVCGLPLGDTSLLTPVVMRNLLGDLWSAGEPAWDRLLALPGLRLHLYGKSGARPGRKMGHYCVLAPSLEEALAIDAQAQALLKPSA